MTFRIDLFFLVFTFQMPLNWKECRPAQVQKLYEVLQKGKRKKAILFSLLPAYFRLIWFFLHDYQRFELLKSVQWVYKTPYNGLHNPIPCKENLIGMSQIAALSFLEFMDAESAFQNLSVHKTQNLMNASEPSLEKFIAVLYRPSKPHIELTKTDFDGDYRQTYNAAFVPSRIKKIQHWKQSDKLLILMHYANQRKQLAAAFPKIFAKTHNPTPNTQNPQTSWLQIVSVLAEGLYNYDKIYQMPIAVIFHELTQKIIEAEKSQNQ